MGTCEYKNLGALGHLCSGCGSSGVSEGRVPGRGCLPPQGTRSLPSPSLHRCLGAGSHVLPVIWSCLRSVRQASLSSPSRSIERLCVLAQAWNKSLLLSVFMGRKHESPGPLRAPGEWRGVLGDKLSLSLLGPTGCRLGHSVIAWVILLEVLLKWSP